MAKEAKKESDKKAAGGGKKKGGKGGDGGDKGKKAEEPKKDDKKAEPAPEKKEKPKTVKTVKIEEEKETEAQTPASAASQQKKQEAYKRKQSKVFDAPDLKVLQDASPKLKELENKLKDNQWLEGQSPSSADNETYEELKDTLILAKKHPHTFGWFCLVSQFNEGTRKSWPAPGAAQAAGGKNQGGKKGKQGGKKQ